MKIPLSSTPQNRQIYVNLGNRFVVFGSQGGMPEPIHFRPEQSPVLPRVADEEDVAEARILDTVEVSGMTRGLPELGQSSPDLVLTDSTGKRIFVEVKVRHRDPKRRDFEAGYEQLHAAQTRGENLELWFFNIERLGLTVMSLDPRGPQFDELVPLNVWSKTEEGVFERRSVVDEVEDWAKRIEALYKRIREWLSPLNYLHFDQSRNVTMSEEMMQKFAVNDRDLPVLDIVRDNHVVISFVPRGLWLLGAWGRIDLISNEGTSILVAIKKDDEYEWRITAAEDRRKTELFDAQTLLNIVSTK